MRWLLLAIVAVVCANQLQDGRHLSHLKPHAQAHRMAKHHNHQRPLSSFEEDPFTCPICAPSPIVGSPLEKNGLQEHGQVLQITIHETSKSNPHVEDKEIEIFYKFQHAESPKAESRPLVVMVNGIMEYHYRFTCIANELLRAGFDVLRYDHPSRGLSSTTDVKFRMSTYTTVLEELVDHVSGGVSRDLFLIGHSMGGAVCTSFIASTSRNVVGAVLMAPAGFGSIFGAKVVATISRLSERVLLPLFSNYDPSMDFITDASKQPAGSNPKIAARCQKEMITRSTAPPLALIRTIRKLPELGDNIKDIDAMLRKMKEKVMLMFGAQDTVINTKGSVGMLADRGIECKTAKEAKEEREEGAADGDGAAEVATTASDDNGFQDIKCLTFNAKHCFFLEDDIMSEVTASILDHLTDTVGESKD